MYLESKWKMAQVLGLPPLRLGELDGVSGPDLTVVPLASELIDRIFIFLCVCLPASPSLSESMRLARWLYRLMPCLEMLLSHTGASGSPGCSTCDPIPCFIA